MQYRTEIAALLAAALRDRPDAPSAAELEGWLERPKDPKLGDWAFPCFRLAKALRLPPPKIAADLAGALAAGVAASPALASAAAAGPYLNFRVDRAALAAATVPAILAGELLARRPATGERVMVEYSQPNTHKAFHVGHVRCAALGDSLARILDWTGADVVPVNYIGDEGTHVAKCLWYLREHHRGPVPETHRGEFLGDLYSKATAMLDLACLTRAPVPGAVAARVLEVEDHPSEPAWCVARVATPAGEHTVVCGARTFAAGDLVPFAAPGLRVAGRDVDVVVKKGVTSSGMLLSEREAGLGDGDGVPVLPAGTEPGAALVELFRVPSSEPGAVPDGVPVLDELARRAAEVSAVLQAIERGEGEIHELWQQTKEWSMAEFRRIYEWLNCRFDHFFFESELGDESKAIVREFQERGVFVESEGAVGADLRDRDLGFCVLIKRDGTALYATRDLALARRKFDEFRIDRSIYVVDSAQSLHFRQVFECLRRMGYEQAERCHHLAYGQVVLPDGKMSSRKGNVILFSQLEERLLARIHGEFLDKYRGEWPDDEIETAGWRIALATMRYGMLDQVHNSQIVFDLDEWSARTGNTGPYLMYAYARTRSILREVEPGDPGDVDWALLAHETEDELLGFVADYPTHVRRAAEQYLPQVVCAYLYELSKKLNRWYKDCSVKHAETAALRTTRRQLVDAVGRVIGHGLGLLGVPVVDRM